MKEKKNQATRGIIYLLVASLIWSFSWGLIKNNLTDLNSSFVAWARLAIALPCFLPLLKIRELKVKEIAQLIFLGALQYGIMYALVIHSYQYLQAHQVVLFTTFTPLYVILFYDIFNKKYSPLYWLTALLALIACALLSFNTNSFKDFITGFLLVQAADICFASGQVLYKKFRTQRPNLKDSSIFGWLYLGAVMITSVFTTYNQAWGNFQIMNTTQILILIYLGTIATGLAYFLWNKGAVSTSPGTLAILNNVKIPLGIFVSVILFNETTNWPKLLAAMGILLLAIYIAEKHAKQKISKAQ